MEPGEIDVRRVSFSGCASARLAEESTRQILAEAEGGAGGEAEGGGEADAGPEE